MNKQRNTDLIVIGLIVIFIFMAVVVMQTHEFNTAECSTMVNWAVKSLPARCLAELSGGK